MYERGPRGLAFHISRCIDAAIPVAESDRHKCVIACLPSVYTLVAVSCIIANVHMIHEIVYT